MAIRLTYEDIPLINEILNEPEMIKLIGFGKDKIDITDSFNNVVCYLSDDKLDLAIFERKDLRIFQGHNVFRSKGRTAIKNGKEIMNQLFHDFNSLQLVFGLTPLKYKTTRWFNTKIGFKFVMYQWLESNVIACRYEMTRNEITKS